MTKGFHGNFSGLFAKVLTTSRNQDYFYVARKYPVTQLLNTEYIHKTFTHPGILQMLLALEKKVIYCNMMFLEIHSPCVFS